MDKGRIPKPSEREKIGAVSQMMRLDMEFDGA